MIHAHLMNVIEPGNYEKELNATLIENNLPPIKIPKCPNSSKLLSVLADGEKLAEMGTYEATTASPTIDNQHTTNISTQHQHHHQETAKQKTNGKTSKQLESEDIDLEFISKESEGWPQNISLSQLMKGLEEKKCTNLLITNRLWNLTKF